MSSSGSRASESFVIEADFVVVTRVLPLEPTKVRVDVLVEQLDRVFPAEVLVGQEVVVVELDDAIA